VAWRGAALSGGGIKELRDTPLTGWGGLLSSGAGLKEMAKAVSSDPKVPVSNVTIPKRLISECCLFIGLEKIYFDYRNLKLEAVGGITYFGQ
jgi:hypothetical protein